MDKTDHFRLRQTDHERLESVFYLYISFPFPDQ
jgi:hypothetical protein